ncbi:MAG: helix-turn-helix transcriptional regulator [Lachnospirales bacterium]
MANELRLSPNYLSSLFKKERGISMADCVTEQRVEAARNMLRFSRFSYADIASILTFSFQSHFTQVFKKCTGVTPRAFCNQAHGTERKKNMKISWRS